MSGDQRETFHLFNTQWLHKESTDVAAAAADYKERVVYQREKMRRNKNERRKGMEKRAKWTKKK
jgi:hypothetical protein